MKNSFHVNKVSTFYKKALAPKINKHTIALKAFAKLGKKAKVPVAMTLKKEEWECEDECW